MKDNWTTEGTVQFEYDGGVTVQRIAQEKHDEHLLTRIRSVDLFTCEAQYHPSCRNKYSQTLRNGEVKMKIPKSDKVTLRRRTVRLSI